MKCTNYCFKPLGLLFLLCLIPLWAFSQNITVKGVVKDATGESVIGASVVQKGTSNGIITDIDGNFTLNVPSNSTIVISFVGYKTQEIPVAGKTQINVTMKEDTEMLDEVVVVGYGQMKRSDLTGSVVSVMIRPSRSRFRLLSIRYCKDALPVCRFRQTPVHRVHPPLSASVVSTH